MPNLVISSIKDLYSARLDHGYYDEVYLRLGELKEVGLLRHAIKYGFFLIKEHGLLRMHCPPISGYGFSTRRVAFWQVRNEVMKVLRDDVDTVEISDKEGAIVLRKRKQLAPTSRITFGIVFSGNLSEEPLLFRALDSIVSIEGATSENSEVIIIGSSAYEQARLFSRYPNLTLRYEILDDVEDHGRFMVCRKKDLAYRLAHQDIVAISHTRIVYPKDLLSWLDRRQFEVAAPRVVYVHEGEKRPYLDFGLMGSYDTARPNPALAIGSQDFGTEYLYFFRRRVPYADGGITFFDKRRIKESPYNKYIAWGEGEDLEMCGRLYFEGFLIDYLFEIECQSQTSKLVMNTSYLKHPGVMPRKLATAIEKRLVSRRFE
ncbi:MAG: hypothetical protein Q8N04_09855 [Nitrospira sp.]|nr:hypothetical protein [Nitrospira sp.]